MMNGFSDYEKKIMKAVFVMLKNANNTGGIQEGSGEGGGEQARATHGDPLETPLERTGGLAGRTGGPSGALIGTHWKPLWASASSVRAHN